jgi:uncharacterized membrane protein YadS
MVQKLSSMIRGLLLTIGLTLIAYIISAYSGINVILMGLLLGIIIGNLFSFSDKYAPGIKFSAGILLEIAIVLIAFSIIMPACSSCWHLWFGC